MNKEFVTNQWQSKNRCRCCNSEIPESIFDNKFTFTELQKITKSGLREYTTKIKQNFQSLRNYAHGPSFQIERNSEVLPTKKEFLDFLERRFSVLENLVENIYHGNTFHSSNVIFFKSVKKSVCNQTGHKIYKYPNFNNLNQVQEMGFIKQNNFVKIVKFFLK